MGDLGTTLIAFCGNIIVAGVIIFVGRWAAGKISGIAVSMMEKRGVDEILTTFAGNAMRIAILAFVIVAALGQIGIETASFVAILAAAGLAIALAFQGSLSNLASGVLLVTFRPFNVGDFVEASGISGIVEKIEIFTTQIRTPDNRTIIIPNASIAGGNIINYSSKPTRRVDLVVGVGYQDDLDKVRAVLTELLEADSRILSDPEPTIGVVELADSSVNFVVRPWVAGADYWPVHFDLHEAIKKRFDAEGINIPFPQRDVHLHQVA
jgi:small conductance mechanosensitive channel